MKLQFRLVTVISMLLVILVLGSCSETAENEHLPEYCQTYSGFMSTASKDLYDLVGDIHRNNYLTAISKIELEFDVDEPGVEIDLSGIQCFQNLTSLTLIGQSFKDISEISALKNIQKISLIDTSVVSIDSFKNLSKVNDLTISNTKTLQSVDGIEEMTKLINLDLSDNGIVNIDGLNNLVNLKDLNLSNNEIVAFPSINQLDQLEYLTLSNNNISQLGEDLSGLRNLISFVANNNNIIDISALDDLVSLEVLDLSFNNLGAIGEGISPDFTSLENSPYLTEIRLNDNDLTSIEGLRGKDLQLEVLALHNNRIEDITPISDYTSLRELTLYNNQISDINDLSGMTNLIDIDIRDNTITDFTDLLTIPNVELVDLSGNQITFIPDITLWSSIVSLNLDSNQLTDTSGVNGSLSLEELIITNNGLETLSGISNMPNLEILKINEIDDTDPIVPIDNPNLIRVIEDSFNNLERLELVNEDFELVLDFDLGAAVEIYGSFNGITNIISIDFSDMDIQVIDEFSINLENLSGLNVSNNNIVDLSFILGNPRLEFIDISNNSINNLEIISGVSTEDLSNLENILASNIIVGNDLVNAFNELDELNYIDLSGTNIITISNSFNKLPQLTTLLIDSFGLETIEDSFNYIFAAYSAENTITFDGGHIGVISNSFNGGEYDTYNTGFYDQISVEDQVSLLVDTYILDSFNNISAVHADSVVISGNSFKDIDNSFNGTTVNRLYLTDNEIEVFTNSFTGTVVIDELFLGTNSISDISTIANITSVSSLDLSYNLLTSISSIDGIDQLAYVNIESQYNTDILTYTLTSLDGLNNLELLDDFNISLNQFDSITGLQNIAITEFTYQIIHNNNTTFSVGIDAFTGTLLTSLDLDGSVLTDIGFLDNLSVITDLVIDVNVDVSEFSAYPIDTTLINLDLDSAQAINDFSVFSTYDLLEELVLDTDTISVINNLDSMDSLSSLIIVNADDITAITNSFNSLSDFVIPGDYLSEYINLDTVSLSFDEYNDVSPFMIFDAITVTDSLNNALSIHVENDAIITPNFDLLSFDSVTEFSFSNPSYTSYGFLDGYSALNTINVTALDINITDINNSNITLIDIADLGAAVDTLNLTVNDNASIKFISDSTGLMNLTSNANSYDIDASLLDVNFNYSQQDIIISGELDSVVINTATLIDLTVASLDASSLDVSSSVLNNVAGSITGTTLISTANITTDVAILAMELYSDTINLYANNANDITFNTPNGTLNFFNSQTAVSGDIDANILVVENNSLVSLSLSSPTIAEITIDAASFNSLSTTSSNIDLLNVTTNVSSLDVIGDIRVGNILDNLLNDLEITGYSVDNVFNVSTTNNEAFTLEVSAFDVNFTAGNLPSITVSNTSTVANLLDMSSMSNNNSVILGSANIYRLDISSDVATFNMSATNLDNTNLALLNATQINLDALNTDAVINSDVNAVSFDTTINVLQYDNVLATSFSFTDLSSAAIVDLGSSVVTGFAFGSATIDTVNVTSDISTVSLTGTNISQLNLDGNSISSLTANVGSGNINFTTTNTGTLATDIIANIYSVDSRHSIVNLANSSVIQTLNFISSPNLNTVTSLAADINDVSIVETTASLAISGSNITNLDISSSLLNNLSTTLNQTTLLSLNTSTSNGLTVGVDVLEMTLSAASAPTVTINSAILETVDITGLDFDFNLTNVGTVLAVDGSSSSLDITSTNLIDLTFVSGSDIGDLVMNDNSITTLNLTNGNVDSLIMNETQGTLTLTAPNTPLITVNTDILDSVTVNGSNSLDLELLYAGGSVITGLDFSGNVNNLDITNDDLTTLGITNTTVNGALVIDGDSLSSYSDTTSTINSLGISSLSGIVTVGTSTSDLVHTGNSAGTLNVTTASLAQNIDTLAVTLNITGASSTFVVAGDNVKNIVGTASTVTLNSNSSLTTTVDLTTTDLTITNPTASSLVVNSGTINNLDVTMNSLSAYDDDNLGVTVSNVDITSSNSSINLTSNSSNIVIVGSLTLTLGLTSTNEVINLNSNAVDVTVFGPITGALDLTSSANAVVLDSNAATVSTTGPTNNTLEFSSTINDIVLSSNAIDLVVTGPVGGTLQLTSSITDLVLESNAVDIEVSGTSSIDLTSTIENLVFLSSASSTIITGSTTGVLNFTTQNVNSTLNTNMNDIIVDSMSDDFTFEYSGILDLTIDFNSHLTTSVNIDSNTGLSNTFIGTINNLRLGIMNSIDYDMAGLSVNNTLTMNDLAITDLSLISPSLISSATTIEINSLSNVNIENIITTMDGSGIILISPIVEADIYNYYYDLKETELTDQEAIDTLRYIAVRDDAISDVLAIFRTNSNFVHTLDPELEDDIDTQVYEIMTYYYDQYLVGEVTTEEDLIISIGAVAVQAIKDSIQATLDDPDIIIVNGELDVLVTEGIAIDADIFGTNELANIGFTIG